MNFKMADEDDYFDMMNGPCRDWLESTVKDDYFEAYDGTKIHYYHAAPENPKAVITMVHGFCEFFGKYHEMAYYFYQAGYAFFFIEMRGHGLSGGKLPEKDLVYVRTYDDYVSDLHILMEKIVSPYADEAGLRKILFAHSMGGAISTLYLEKYPDEFSGAALSCPMLLMTTGGLSPFMVKLLTFYVYLCHRGKHVSVKQTRFDGKEDFEGSCYQSRVRYDYMFDMRLKNPDYQSCAATFSWVIASLRANKKLLKNSGKVKTPLVIFEAGHDDLVLPEGYKTFIGNLPKDTPVKEYFYPTSKHEIFNSADEPRKDYFEKLFSSFDEFCSIDK